jgi:hypothetical protein
MALDPGPLMIAAVALPGHPPFPGDRLDVAVALGGVGLRGGAEHGIGTGWDDHATHNPANLGSVAQQVPDLTALGTTSKRS